MEPITREPSLAKRDLVGSVTVAEAPADQRPVFDRLIQLYKYDFSEFAPIGSPLGEVEAKGRFAYPRLESYWQGGGRIPLLIRADDHIVGFALLNQCLPWSCRFGVVWPRRLLPEGSESSLGMGNAGPVRCCA